MKQLHISDTLSLPLDAATQTFAFIARKGAGKTYAAGLLVEQLLGTVVQCVILDTVGNWYGLRLSADGKSSGFDVPVIGGLRGDIPLEATGGHLIADIVVETGRSLILDISQFSLGDRKRFCAAFGERLWLAKKREAHPSPLMLVIEESQLVIPQNVRGDDAKMVGIFEEIIRLGRNYGVGCAMISQRPQSVNKDVLNQAECLFVGQVNGFQERKALKDWITHQGIDQHLIDELPSLPIGTMYVWSPQWLQILQKVKIAKKQTFDSTATPKVGEARVSRELKALDLEVLKTAMAATIERAKAEDPRELRRHIADLDKELRSLRSDKAQTVAPVDLQENYERGCQHGHAEAAKKYEKLFKHRESILRKLVRLAREMSDVANSYETEGALPEPEVREVPPRSETPKIPAGLRPTRMRKLRAFLGPAETNGDAKLAAGAVRMLHAIAMYYPNPVREGQVAAQANLRRTGGTFSNYKSNLRTAGLIEVRGNLLSATEAGMKLAGEPDTPRTTDEMLALWLPRLPAGAQRMLNALVDHNEPLSRERLAELAGGLESSGGTFSNYLSNLRTAGLIVDASDRQIEANRESLFLA